MNLNGNIIVVLYGTCVRACVWKGGGRGWVDWGLSLRYAARNEKKKKKKKKKLDISWFINIYFLENDIVLV